MLQKEGTMIDIKGLKIDTSRPIQKSEQFQPLASQLKKKPFIIFCVPGNNFSGNFLTCWTNTIQYCLANNIDFSLSNQYSSVVHFARSKCLGGDVLRGVNQKPFNGKIEYTHIMWLDSDMVWSPEQIGSLLLREVPVVAGLYSQEDRNSLIAVEKWDETYFKEHGLFEYMNRKKIEGLKQLIPVVYAGMGFMLVTKAAMESIEYPWFTSLEKKINDLIDITGEDAAFCLRLNDKGFTILVDPTIMVGHEKKVVIL
jgi:hypothetical protein